jgi:mRNA interferase RelE/StbE
LTGRRSETPYRVLVHAAVPKEIEAIPPALRRRVKDTLSGLAANPLPVGASRIRGRVNAYRIRVDDYRIVYEVHVTEVVVYVVGGAHRREVYRRILRRN